MWSPACGGGSERMWNRCSGYGQQRDLAAAMIPALHIEGILPDTTEEEILEYFSEHFGKITRLILPRTRDGKCLGTARIEMATFWEAESTIGELVPKGYHIRYCHDTKLDPKNVFISHVGARMDCHELQRFCSWFGSVDVGKVCRRGGSVSDWNHAFVRMSSEEDAVNLIRHTSGRTLNRCDIPTEAKIGFHRKLLSELSKHYCGPRSAVVEDVSMSDEASAQPLCQAEVPQQGSPRSFFPKAVGEEGLDKTNAEGAAVGKQRNREKKKTKTCERDEVEEHNRNLVSFGVDDLPFCSLSLGGAALNSSAGDHLISTPAVNFLEITPPLFHRLQGDIPEQQTAMEKRDRSVSEQQGIVEASSPSATNGQDKGQEDECEGFEYWKRNLPPFLKQTHFRPPDSPPILPLHFKLRVTAPKEYIMVMPFRVTWLAVRSGNRDGSQDPSRILAPTAFLCPLLHFQHLPPLIGDWDTTSRTYKGRQYFAPIPPETQTRFRVGAEVILMVKDGYIIAA